MNHLNQIRFNYKITDSDMIVLESVDSYLRRNNVPPDMPVQQKLIVIQQAKDYLYPEIAQRVPKIAGYVMHSDMEADDMARGLNTSLENHVMDPLFVDVLMRYLTSRNNADDKCTTGAYLAKIANKWIETHTREVSKPAPTKKDSKGKGDKSVEPPTTVEEPNLEPIKHLFYAVEALLSNLTSFIRVKCCDLTERQILAIAACIATNNEDTIKELIESDMPITADILDVVENPSTIIKAALLLEQTDIPTGMSKNQVAFTDSLKRWVYRKLESINTQAIYTFLVSVYGFDQNVDVSTKFINPKECGNQYPNLLNVAKTMINKK